MLHDMIREAVNKQISLRTNSGKWAELIPERCPPIVWFGDVERYMRQTRESRLVTLAANPSPAEYLNSSGTLLRAPRLFVPSTSIDSSMNDVQLSTVTQRVYKAQNAYFYPPIKSGLNKKGSHLTGWFGDSGGGRIEGFLNGMGWSYFDDEDYHSAVHIDMFPFVTTEVFTNIRGRVRSDLFESQWAQDFLSRLLDELQPRYILTFGVANIRALRTHFTVQLPAPGRLDAWDKLDVDNGLALSKHMLWNDKYDIIAVRDYLPGPNRSRRPRELVYPWGQSAKAKYTN